MSAESDHMDDLERIFGSSWRFSEIALWIEARQRSKPALPPWMLVWAYDFLRIWKAQQKMNREDEDGVIANVG